MAMICSIQDELTHAMLKLNMRNLTSISQEEKLHKIKYPLNRFIIGEFYG